MRVGIKSCFYLHTSLFLYIFQHPLTYKPSTVHRRQPHPLSRCCIGFDKQLNTCRCRARFHKAQNFKYFHSNLNRDITRYMATMIGMQGKSILGRCEISPRNTAKDKFTTAKGFRQRQTGLQKLGCQNVVFFPCMYLDSLAKARTLKCFTVKLGVSLDSNW